MKRKIAALIALTLCVSLIGGCTNNPLPTNVSSEISTEELRARLLAQMQEQAEGSVSFPEEVNPNLREGDWEYSYENGGVAVTRCFTDAETVKIPEYIAGKKVTEIYYYYDYFHGEKRFFKSKNVRHVILSDTIKYADFTAFTLDNIKTITFGKNLKKFYIGHFDEGCWAPNTLTEFKVSDKNPYFKAVDGVLYNRSMTKLRAYPASKSGEEFTVPDSVREITKRAFDDTANLKRINLNDNLEKIRAYAFTYAGKLESIKFPKNLKTVEERAFMACKKLANVDFNDTSAYIDDSAFEYSKIEDILESEYKHAKSGPFYKNKILYSYKGTVPKIFKVREGTRIISAGALSNRYDDKPIATDNFKALILPDSVERIFDYAFSDCENLEHVKFSKNLRSISSSAFDNTKLFKNIKADADELAYYKDILFGVRYISETEHFRYPEDMPENLTVRPGTKIIADQAFNVYSWGRESPITTVSMPKGLKTIGSWAFAGCKKITQLTIPASVDFIGENAFFDTDITFTVRKNSYAHKYLTEHRFKKIKAV